jgi:ribosomal protein S18 acetylase RimI-like enzyme
MNDNQIKIREYRAKDKIQLLKLIGTFQEYLTDIDDLKRLRKQSGYEEKYFKTLTKKVKKYKGILLVAEGDKKIVGFVAGIIQEQSELDKLSHVKTRTGRLLDIFITSSYRKKGIGKILMNIMEEFFKERKCTVIYFDVFGPNKNALKFYKKRGYAIRSYDVIKIISQ